MKKVWLVLGIIAVFMFAAGCGTSDTSSSNNNNETSGNISHHTKDNHIKEKTAKIKNIEASPSSDKDEQSEPNDQKDKQTKQNKDNNHETKSKSTTQSQSNTTNSTNSHSTSKSSDTNDDQSSVNQNNRQPSNQSDSTNRSDTQENDDNDNTDTSNQDHSKSNNQDKQDKQKEASDNEPKPTVTVSVTSGDVKGTVLPETNVSVEDGDTAMDVTRTILKQKEIQYSIRGSGGSAYMEGIDNLYEKDEGPLSGWHIRVNGEMIGRSAGAVSVEAGDTVTWSYTTNYIEDSDN